jgi:tetratricopeptide (TPR) repeat protein
LCLNSLWRYDHAIAAFRRAIELDGAYAPAHNNLGLSLQAVGEVEDAIASFRRAIEIMPDFAEARWNLDVAMRQLEAG